MLSGGGLLMENESIFLVQGQSQFECRAGGILCAFLALAKIPGRPLDLRLFGMAVREKLAQRVNARDVRLGVALITYVIL
jgi:hypothetical protein